MPTTLRPWRLAVTLILLLSGTAVAQVCPFRDRFNNSSSLSTGWVVPHGSFTVTDYSARGTSPQSYAVYVHPITADAIVGVTIPRPTTYTWIGVVARASTPAPDRDHYAAYIDPNGYVGVSRRTAYVYTPLALGPRVVAGKHRLKLQATGSGPVRLRVWIDGLPVIDTTDTSGSALTSAGQDGFFDYNGTSEPSDDFEARCAEPPPDPLTCHFTDSFFGSGGLVLDWYSATGRFESDGQAPHGFEPLSYLAWGGGPDPVNAIVSADIPRPTTPAYVGVFVRGRPGGADRDHYAAYLTESGTVGLARRRGYVYSYLASLTPAVGPGMHRMVVRVAGSNPVNISVWVDGALIIDHPDTTPDRLTGPGVSGLFDYTGSGLALDNFELQCLP